VTWYLDISPVTEMIDLGVDSPGRSLISLNFNVTKAYSATFMEEMFGLLNGIAVASGSVNISSLSITPDGDGPFLTLIDTGGTSPLRTHNSILPAYPRPSLQVIARAKGYLAARAAGQAAYDVLAAVRNRDVPPVSIS